MPLNITLPAYFELDGQIAKLEKIENGNVLVTVPKGISIADFMQDGTVITEADYLRLARSSANRKAVV